MIFFSLRNSLLALPEPNMIDVNKNLLRRFELMQHLHQQFWSLWSKSYLNNLQTRTKWKTPTPTNQDRIHSSSKTFFTTASLAHGSHFGSSSWIRWINSSSYCSNWIEHFEEASCKDCVFTRCNKQFNRRITKKYNCSTLNTFQFYVIS